jgi:beta-galactosidase
MLKRLFLLLFIMQCNFTFAQNSVRQQYNMDLDWKFILGDVLGAEKIDFNDKNWRTLNLPHDWSIELANDENEPGGGNVGYYPSGKGWYRKSFDLNHYSPDNKYSIEFDGVYMNSEVWVNGVHIGKNPYGYSSFSFDLSSVLKPEGNVIAVFVDNSLQPNSRWYTGSGIYRHVRLIKTNPLHIEKWGVFSYTKSIGEKEARIFVETSLINDQEHSAQDVVVKNSILNKEGKEVAFVETKKFISARSKTKCEQEIKVPSPKFWSVKSPYLYTLETTVIVDGKETDYLKESIGIRTIEYNINEGFLLNGQQVKMKGVNLHHDGGPVGAAVPERVWERRLEILKEGGCNAIRTAHNPPAPEFLDLCDQLGFLVMDEAFDEWVAGKREYTYKIFFKDWYEKDLKAMVYRDRNHPSVVMWSIGNEVPDQSTPEGPELAEKLIDICKEADPTRLVTAGNDNIFADRNPATEEYLAVYENEIIGYNYPDRWHERRELMYFEDKQNHPNRRVVATETGSISGDRGVYDLGNDPDKVDAKYTQGRLIDVEQRWKYTLLHDYVIGDFMWTGIDYYGESRRFPRRGSSSGYLDVCGFKKDGFYFFKSIWTEEPTLHLLPHWNLEGREGQVVPVVCFTNCDTVELFLNGKSYGVKYLEFPRKGNTDVWNKPEEGKVYTVTGDLHLSWDVVYSPGELIAKGRKDGKEYTCKVITASEPTQLRISADKELIKTTGGDVAHITVEVLDKNGNIVPTSDNLIEFEVEGAEIIGIESGNLWDNSSTKDNKRKAHSGLCLSIIEANKAGKITVKATSEGLEGSSVDIEAIVVKLMPSL